MIVGPAIAVTRFMSDEFHQIVRVDAASPKFRIDDMTGHLPRTLRIGKYPSASVDARQVTNIGNVPPAYGLHDHATGEWVIVLLGREVYCH